MAVEAVVVVVVVVAAVTRALPWMRASLAGSSVLSLSRYAISSAWPASPAISARNAGDVDSSAHVPGVPPPPSVSIAPPSSPPSSSPSSPPRCSSGGMPLVRYSTARSGFMNAACIAAITSSRGKPAEV